MKEFSDLVGLKPMSNPCIVLCTCDEQAEAKKIAEALVTRQLAACVNIIGGISSVYQWQGQLEQAEEHQLVIKTRHQCLDQAYALVRELHSYDTPEWLVLDVHSGGQDYLDWITSSTTK